MFTDIEGSTRRWERDRAAMSEALERHDTALREAIQGRRGHVFKTVGDAFCCAFANVGDAVEAALAIQRTLAERDFSAVGGIVVRIAIHTGTANERDGDYFGPTVNRVARLLAIAHGGQVLLSGTAAELYADDRADHVTLIDLGEHYLKDLGRPERVHQIRAAGLRSEFPALQSVGVIPNNIPEFASPFVGRATEVAEIAARLATSRGITLCGTGGIGKTRCALKVGQDCITRFLQGVWFVELASIASGGMVATTIANTLGISDSTSANVLDALCSRLKNQSVLLVLDNCEHVLDDAVAVVETLLQRCPLVRVLATSREPLGYIGEVLIRLPPLAMPAAQASLTAESGLSYDAVALFVARASDVNPGFHLTSQNLSTVVSICRRLDGIALAIELAAMRLRSMSLDQLSAGLRERFRVLTGKSRSIIPRQQTLRALIDWSYELLDDRERTVFRGLSVFAGSFTVEDCESVCGGFGDSRADMLDVISSLVDKSLVSAPLSEGSDDDGRYRLIGTLREYAAEMLGRSDETEVRYGRLARWALGVVTAAHREWVTCGTEQWERRYKAALENVRSALEWSLERGNDVQMGIQIVARGRRMYGALAPAEGLRWTELARQQSTTNDDEVGAEILVAHAQMNVALRRPAEALASAREAKNACAGLGLEESGHEAQIFAGYSLAALGRSTEAKDELLDAQRYFEGKALAQFCGIVASDLGVTYMNAGELDDARASFEAALRAFEVTSSSRFIRAVVTNLAEVHFQAGDVEAAIERIGSELARDERGDAMMFLNLSAYLIAAGRFDQALEYARESLIAAEASRREVETIIAFLHIAAASVSAHDARNEVDPAGARLFGYVESWFAARSYELEFTERQEFQALVAALNKRNSATKLEALKNEGRAWNDRMALQMAMTVRL